MHSLFGNYMPSFVPFLPFLWLARFILHCQIPLLYPGYLLSFSKSFLLFYSFESFPHQPYPIVFYWSLSDHKSPQVSRTLLSILADLNSAVIWMVSTRVLISNSFGPLTNSLVTLPKALIAISKTITFSSQASP